MQYWNQIECINQKEKTSIIKTNLWKDDKKDKFQRIKGISMTRIDPIRIMSKVSMNLISTFSYLALEES